MAMAMSDLSVYHQAAGKGQIRSQEGERKIQHGIANGAGIEGAAERIAHQPPQARRTK
jgi:hypothetical protein